MGKTPAVEPAGASILTRLTSVMKPSPSNSQLKQTAAPGTSMSNANSSDFFIRMALDMLLNSKESRRHEPLKTAIRTAVGALDNPEPSQTPIAIFKPFQIACESGNQELATIAIDCMGKLFSYNYWGRIGEEYVPTAKDRASADGDGRRPAAPGVGQDDHTDDDEDNDGTEGMLSFVIDTICNGFVGESTDEKVQLQIIKALQAALTTSNPSYALHGAILLKVIRTTYNIFLLSKSNDVQIVAQGTVTQMVQNIFGRVPKQTAQSSLGATGPAHNSSSSISSAMGSLSSTVAVTVTSPAKSDGGNASDAALEKSANGLDVGTTADAVSSQPLLDTAVEAKPSSASVTPLSKKRTVRGGGAGIDAAVTGQALKDAFKVFRTLCILSMKPIPSPEGTMDLRSQPVRSKLLALHLISTVLASHTYVFSTPSATLAQLKDSSLVDGLGPIQFIDAVKEFLMLSLSRNATSVIPPVFEVSMEIFGRLLLQARTTLKREISIFFTEIVIPILEAKKNIPWYQRYLLLKNLQKIFGDANAEGGRVLVEIYLNYDCDPEATAKENIWERLIGVLSKIAGQPGDPAAQAPAGPVLLSSYVSVTPGAAPALTTNNLVALTRDQVRDLYSSTGDTREIKKRGLELIARGILRPLVQWCQVRTIKAQQQQQQQQNQQWSQSGPNSESEKTRGEDGESESAGPKGALGLVTEEEGKQLARANSLRAEDDPAAFENLKHRKQVMLEGTKRFNQKPKKGMQFLLDSNCIPSRTPKDIAKFLLNTDGLNKSMIGEFLGEGEEENIAIMHAFVDEMDFSNMAFVEALRHFLQSFRLPGESQKIDRFMLKFAERYVKGNPKSFSSADTAYVLAYSVIMLNTDQHNAQVKRRMTKSDFLKNNRGIDEGKDIAAEVLEGIFDEIQSNEIVMKDEVDKSKAKDASKNDKPLTIGLSAEVDALIFGKPKKRDGPPDVNKTSESMAMKTEAIFTSLMRNKTGSTRRSTSQKKDDSTVGGSGGLGGGVGKSDNGSSFFSASYYEHVKPMFQLIWMSILTAISAPLQETDDLDTISVALDGFRSAIYISCLFDMDLETKAFVSTLGKFTILNNIQEMRAKNFEAIKALLDVAYQQGNSLSDSWSVVVQCISQLEKLQIVAGLTAGEDSSRSRGVSERTSPRRDQAQRQPGKGGLLEDVAAEASSQSMTLLVDRIFTASAKLSGPAIVHFVRALCDSSWEEITSSSDKEHPRMYCLQRLVEISYYNMKRIRVEWSQLWAILGQHFNQVGSYPNTNVAFFAVDKLRQLTMKFLELEELPNFKFQKDFLRPFEEILRNNVDVKVKDMCLACIQQIAQAKAKSLKSGWKTLFGVLLRASREATESIVVLSFDITKGIFKSSFDQVVLNAAYPEFVACVVEFCKNTKFGKISLHAIELLRQSIGRVAEMLEKQERAALLKEASMMNATPLRANLETDEAAAGQLAGSPARGLLRQGLPDEDVSFKYWMPVLFGLHDVIMASDLEVRTRGLQYLFETLKAHGSQFSPEFWGLLAKGVLFPIFEDLKHSGATSLANSKFADKEQMLVWLSTTLIQALRQLVDLFSFYFESLHFMLDGMLDILKTCLTHENEALSRIGSTCLQQLIEHNVARLGDKEWSRIVDLFEKLCEETTPYFLFFDLQAAPGSNSDASSINPADLDDSLPFLKSAFGPPPDKKEFQRLIGKCVLHLLVIQTLDDVMLTGPNDVVYKSLGPTHLQCLTNCFDRSFRFARAFNNYTELRTALYRMGYMKQMPNLLKQETLSVTAFIRYMAKAALDKSTGRSDLRGQSEQRFVELCLQILSHFNTFDSEAKRRNINSWKPVVVMILNALVDLDDDQFARHIRSFYTHLVNLLLHDTGPELRLALHTLLMRTGVAFAILSNDMYVSSIAAASAGDGLSAGQTRSPDSLASPEDASISGGGMG